MSDALDAFMRAALVPRDRDHSSGDLSEAEAILNASPEVATADIHAAAVLGDDSAVRRFLQANPAAATEKGGPYGWDALTHLCFSRFLRLDQARSEGFFRAATALLDAGADANTGWFEADHHPDAGWECVLYGAAGIAHQPELTRLLLARGANPNDDETVYHTPEGNDNRALMVLVQSGRLTEESLGTILTRKADWHDYEGMKWLLAQGVMADSISHFGNAALQHSIRRDNSLEIIDLLLDHGADPLRLHEGVSPAMLAVRGGRSDVLDSMVRRGIRFEFEGVDRLIEACARRSEAVARAIAREEPDTLQLLLDQGGTLLAQFAGTENVGGARLLLDVGVPVDALHVEGDGYYGVAPNSTALHVAAWRLAHGSVKLLVERGANVNALDGRGRSPLQLAVSGCVDSYWTEFRSPASVKVLLDAGARLDGVKYPCGYQAVDELLTGAGATAGD